MNFLSKLRAELAETNIDVLAPEAAFMVKGGGSSRYGRGSKKKKSSKKGGKRSSKRGNGHGHGGGYGGGHGYGCGW